MAAAAGSNGETLCPMSAPRGRFFMVNGVNQPERWVARAETQMSFWRGPVIMPSRKIGARKASHGASRSGYIDIYQVDWRIR